MLGLFRDWIAAAKGDGQLGLRIAQATVNAIEEAGKTEPSNDVATVARALEAATEMLGGPAAVFGARLVVLLSDRESGDGRAIATDVRKLVRAPLKTGMERLKNALVLAPTNQVEREYAQKLFFSAKESFEVALNYCGNEAELMLVRLLQAVCASQIDGASQEAVHLLDRFCESIRAEAARRSESLMRLSHQLRALDAKAIEPSVVGSGGGGSFAGAAKAEAKASVAQAAHDARLLRQRIAGVEREFHTLERAAQGAEELTSSLRGDPAERVG